MSHHLLKDGMSESLLPSVPPVSPFEAYTIILLQQPTVFANEIVWAPNSTETKYHRLFFSDGTVLRREKYQDYDWTPWREDEDYPKPPKGR